ncbi:MAG: hypothetical protein ABJA79_08435, partial [Parafilimonas sp.]
KWATAPIQVYWKTRLPVSEAGLKIKERTGIEQSHTRLWEFMKRHKFRFLKTGHIPAKVNNTEQKSRGEETLKPLIKAGSEW